MKGQLQVKTMHINHHISVQFIRQSLFFVNKGIIKGIIDGARYLVTEKLSWRYGIAHNESMGQWEGILGNELGL